MMAKREFKHTYEVMTVTKRVQFFKVEAKDEEVAAMIAVGRAKRGEESEYVESKTVEAEKVKRISPRFIVRDEGLSVLVIDTEVDVVAAECYSLAVANITKNALNNDVGEGNL